MDPRIVKGSPDFVDMIGTYHMALFIFALFIVPQQFVTAAAAILFTIFGFLIYSRRRRLRRSELPQPVKMSHINLIIMQFWRLTYLSIVPIIVAAVIIHKFGDASILTALEEKYAEGSVPTPMESYEAMLAHQIKNGTLIFWSNFMCFLPLSLYVLAKLFKGYQKLKAEEEVNPNSWSLRS